MNRAAPAPVGSSMCRRLGHPAVVRRAVLFPEPDSKVWMRDFCICDGLPPSQEIPSWAVDPKQQWDSPRDPVTYSAAVEVGHTFEAERWVTGEC